MSRYFILTLLSVIQIFALNIPTKSEYDGRMVVATYNASDVTKIYVKTGYTTAIKFANDERIVDIASGFTDGYHLLDRSNILFVAPKPYISKISMNDAGEMRQETVAIEPTKEEWRTNLIIVTNKRDYVFDLQLADNSVYYKVSFNYPQEEEKLREAQAAAKAMEDEQTEIKKELERVTVPRNWDFYMNINPGSDDIAPDFAYDDGVFTYLGFDSTKTIPSVFRFENEEESILNTHIKKDGNYDVLVVHKISPMIILRSGKKIVGILNGGYAKNPIPATKETSSEQIKREVIDAK